MIRTALLHASRTLYEMFARPLMFQALSAEAAHKQAMQLCAWFDKHPFPLETLRRATLPDDPVTIGGVTLESPMILAAGFVKGIGFASEGEALWAVQQRMNIIPGWRSMPALVGAVEFGSFTRHPRMGNDGTVLWRNSGGTRSLQNRMGLRNPGAKAAAAFLAANPPNGTFGINIALSPGISDPEQETREVREALAAFLDLGVNPAWFTLNISCPNTEDDPAGNQSENNARHLCSEAIAQIGDIPLWVKISPDLSPTQRSALMRAFAETGVRAVIATNTLPQPTPDNPHVIAGMSGKLLFDAAHDTVKALICEKKTHGYAVDVVACGGVMDGAAFDAYRQLGVQALQYWSALVYRGPLAAAVILNEAEKL